MHQKIHLALTKVHIHFRNYQTNILSPFRDESWQNLHTICNSPMFTRKNCHMKSIKTIAALTMVASLAACGGGGDGEGDNASAEGFWNGTDAAILITNTGELWGVEVVGSALALYKGTVSTSGSNFSAQLSGYLDAQKVNATASGTVVPQQTLQGSVSASGRTSNFTMTYGSTYNATPNLAALAGNYTDTTGGTFTLATNGAFSGTNSLGCTETGTITPDVSGKNFYRVVLTIGPNAACGAYAGQTAMGVLAVAGTDMLVGGVVLGNLGDAFLLTRAMPPV